MEDTVSLPLWCRMLEDWLQPMVRGAGNQTFDTEIDMGAGGWRLQFVDMDLSRASVEVPDCQAIYVASKEEVHFHVQASMLLAPFFWNYQAILVCHNRGEGFSYATMEGSISLVLHLRNYSINVTEVDVIVLDAHQVKTRLISNPEVDVLFTVARSQTGRSKVARALQQHLEISLNDKVFNTLGALGFCGLIQQAWANVRYELPPKVVNLTAGTAPPVEVDVPFFGTHPIGVNLTYIKVPESVCKEAHLHPTELHWDMGDMMFAVGMEWLLGNTTVSLMDAGIAALHFSVRVVSRVDFADPNSTTVNVSFSPVSWQLAAESMSSVSAWASWLAWATKPTIQANLQAYASCGLQSAARWYLAGNTSEAFDVNNACNETQPAIVAPEAYFSGRWLAFYTVYIVSIYLVFKCVEVCCIFPLRGLCPCSLRNLGWPRKRPPCGASSDSAAHFPQASLQTALLSTGSKTAADA